MLNKRLEYFPKGQGEPDSSLRLSPCKIEPNIDNCGIGILDYILA